ncbi:MAG: hypothetical protein HY425_02945 [Candidatus Levybacteria bacterium]|nr:hypothetical protein [Candidatus Levybacteria bacterium]
MLIFSRLRFASGGQARKNATLSVAIVKLSLTQKIFPKFEYGFSISVTRNISTKYFYIKSDLR